MGRQISRFNVLLANMLSHWLNRLTDRIVPERLRRDPDEFRQAKRVAAVDLVCLFWAVLFTGLYGALGSWRCGLAVSLALPTIGASLALLALGRSPTLCGNLLCFAGWQSLSLVVVFSGGWLAPPLFWYTVLPLVALYTAGALSGLAWTVIPLVTLAIFADAGALGVSFPQDVPEEFTKPLHFLVLACLILCHSVLATVRVGSEQRIRVALAEANRRLRRTRETLKMLEAGFGISVAEWEALKREKISLERLLAEKFGIADEPEEDDDGDLSDGELDAMEVEELDTRRDRVMPPRK